MSQRVIIRTVLYCAIVVSTIGSFGILQAQSRNPRATGDYGVGLTFAVYGYDEGKSQTFQDQIHLSTTFDTPEKEMSFIRDRYGAEEMALRRVKTIGLAEDEFYTDTNRLGPDFLSVTIVARGVTKSKARIDITASYGKDIVMSYRNVDIERFETIMLKGKPGMFGIRTFVGPGGVQESAVAMQTLLVTITAQIDPLEKVANRPSELSHPTDENGSPVKLEEKDKFSPPVVTNRVDATLPLRRPILRTVLVEGIITPEGRVTNIKVLRGLDPDLDKIAVDAFRRFQFQGAKLNDKPVYASWRDEIAFRVPGQ
ncbi:MAG TPA: energy transducer TonB [Blastocatellia bacterium]|nr:energy transducer TonB [Blastocatellia bacterium]